MKRFILSLLWLAIPGWAQEPLTPLGQAFEINSPWKLQAGDDLRWAQPDFDDSAWLGASALPRYDGFVWYRMTVRVPEVPGPYGLWIPRVLRAAEFFVNGQKLGVHGSVDKWYLERRDLVEPLSLPAGVRSGDLLHIAVRVNQTVSGPGIALKPVIGSWKSVSDTYQLALLKVYREASVRIVLSLFSFATILLFLIYWRGNAERVEALWVSGILLSYFFLDFEAYRAVGARQIWTVASAVCISLSLLAAWRFFKGTRSLSWRAQAPYLAICGLLLIVQIVGRLGLIPWVYAVSSLACVIAFILIRNTIDAWRRMSQGESWILWPFAGYSLFTLASLIDYADIIQIAFKGSQVGMPSTVILVSDPVPITLINVGEFFSGAIIAGVLVRRIYLVLQEKQALAAELEAAKQVQELLLPAVDLATPGFIVESAYLPAREVGGDFYFVNPLADGRLMVVVGDVSGKGLRAAMLVSVVVGILRTATAQSAASILEALNAGLVGRTGGGFVTACSVLIDADGSATIASAGHCPVYRNGSEVMMEPSLPLGVVPHVQFEEVASAPGSFLMLSDGVIEAENAQRELFGFDRTREISGESAAKIAAAAKAWGQNDDITVVSVRRNA